MPWTKAQQRARRENATAARRASLARKRRWEIETIAKVATAMLDGDLYERDDPTMDTKTGLAPRDDCRNLSSRIIRIRTKLPHQVTSNQISRKRFKETVKRLGWRVARALAWGTPYYTCVWPSPQTEEEASISKINDPEQLEKYEF